MEASPRHERESAGAWGGGYEDVGGERGSVRDKKEVRDGVRGRGGEKEEWGVGGEGKCRRGGGAGQTARQDEGLEG